MFATDIVKNKLVFFVYLGGGVIGPNGIQVNRYDLQFVRKESKSKDI